MDKVIEEFPDDTSPVEMEEVANNKDDEEKEITSNNADEGVMHRDVTDNKK